MPQRARHAFYDGRKSIEGLTWREIITVANRSHGRKG